MTIPPRSRQPLSLGPPSRQLGRAWVWVLIAIVIVAVAAWFIWFRKPAAEDVQQAGRRGPGGPGGAPTSVLVAKATVGDVNVYLSALGTVTPLATVTVKSRVDGQLLRVLFREGQIVKANELLAEIDPRAFQVQLTQAEGQMAKDQALLANARVDLTRYRTLFEQDSIARQQLDTQESLVRQYEGAIKADQGGIDSAKLQLDYTRVTSPIAGRVGLRPVDPGNIVHASDTAGVAVITQIEPISVMFSLPEDNVPQVMKKLRANEKLEVQAYDRAGSTRLSTGYLASADNQIDPATGTVKLRAQFTNHDFGLFPNQFVNVRMLVDVLHNAVTVPSAAVQRGQNGMFVYIARPDNTVTVRQVTPGPTQGDRVAITAGVADGESVVVDGMDRLREGAKINVTDAAARAAAATAAPGRRRNGGGGEAAKNGAGNNDGSRGGSAEGQGQGRSGTPDAAGKAPAPAGSQAGPQGGPSAEGPGGGFGSLTPEERQKRWEAINRRIDAGEFGEEIKKLPEEQRKQRMRELRQQRQGGGGGQ